MKRLFLFSLICLTSTLSVFQSEGLAASIFKASRRLSGFSPDNRHYIYLESFRNSVTEVPTANIQIVDVMNNSCVRNGCIQTEYERSSSNLSNQAAENDLLQRTAQIRNRLRLNQLKVGTPLPIISRFIGEDRAETIEVRVNNQTKPIQIRLEQKYIPSIMSGGTSDVDRSSVRLIVNYNYRQLTLGDLDNYRDSVKKYSIREVRLSPNRLNIIVLIDVTQATYEGVLQTTLVQGFPI